MRTVFSLLALAALSTPAAIAAQSGDDRVTVRIDTAGVDLNSAKGRAIVEKRINTSIKKACTLEANSRYGYGRDIVDDACVANARAQAFAEIARIAATEGRSGGQVAAN